MYFIYGLILLLILIICIPTKTHNKDINLKNKIKESFIQLPKIIPHLI